MNAPRFIGITKLTSINLRKVKVGVSRTDFASKKYSREILEGMKGGVPEESSEITKAGVIDSRISIDLPLWVRVRACHCIGGRQCFPFITFLYRCLTIFCWQHVSWRALYCTRYRRPFHRLRRKCHLNSHSIRWLILIKSILEQALFQWQKWKHCSIVERCCGIFSNKYLCKSLSYFSAIVKQ